MSIARIIISLLVVFVFACNNKPERPEPVLDANYQAPATDAAAPATTPEPDQNAAGVWHYTCSNGCAGGAGSAVPCATCGTTLVHNTEYHNSATPATPSPNAPTGVTNGNDNITIIPPESPAATTPEPAQNTSGVWHYTCANGCAGGAGSAGTCAGCGGPLSHNTNYHN